MLILPCAGPERSAIRPASRSRRLSQNAIDTMVAENRIGSSTRPESVAGEGSHLLGPPDRGQPGRERRAGVGHVAHRPEEVGERDGDESEPGRSPAAGRQLGGDHCDGAERHARSGPPSPNASAPTTGRPAATRPAAVSTANTTLEPKLSTIAAANGAIATHGACAEQLEAACALLGRRVGGS